MHSHGTPRLHGRRFGVRRITRWRLATGRRRYHLGVYENIKLAKEIFPDFEIVIYYDDSVPVERIKNLENESVTLANATHIPCNSMMWRFLSADTDGIFLSRDILRW